MAKTAREREAAWDLAYATGQTCCSPCGAVIPHQGARHGRDGKPCNPKERAA